MDLAEHVDVVRVIGAGEAEAQGVVDFVGELSTIGKRTEAAVSGSQHVADSDR